ncbi:MAG TPA: laccase domain-containing protein, partial [Allosphingosinicella sp.]
MTVEPFRASALADHPHGFLGRLGGVSQGVVKGLNVGWGAEDDPEAVRENRRRAVEAVAPGARLVTLHQTHSPTTLYVTEPFPDDARPH